MADADALVRDLIERDAWLRRTVQSVVQRPGHQIVVTVGGPDVSEAHIRITTMLAEHALAGAVAIEGHGGGGLVYD